MRGLTERRADRATILSFAILILVLCSGIGRGLHAETMQLVVDGRPRTYLLERPQAQGSSPTLVVLHGAGGTAQLIAQQTGLAELAPRDGFAVAFPQARANVWNRFSSGTEPPQASEVYRQAGGIPDDFAFLKMLVADLVRRGISDPRRVYFAGFSNGGFMTLNMFCFGTDMFAGIALVISSMPEATGEQCRPAKPLPVVVLSGTADTVVPYAGGAVRLPNPASPLAGILPVVWSTDRLIAFFRRLNGCVGSAEAAVLPGQSPYRIEVERSTNCGRGPVVAYKVLGGTHSSTGTALNTGRVLLDFFSDPARGAAETQVAASAQSKAVPSPPPQAGPAAEALAKSVKSTFEKYNLLGTLAWDCSKPASQGNPYFVHRLRDGDTVQRDLMTDQATRQWFAIVDKVTEQKPNEIALSGTITGRIGGKDIDNRPSSGVWRVEPNRLMQLEGTIDGHKVIANGRYTGSGFQLPWTNRCGG